MSMDKKASILCVDDEPVNLIILEELLRDSYALDTVKSGEGCLQQVGIQRPDLILLDVNMPEMSGLETCERLRADSETAEIPVIFVSALASHEELMAGYEAGGDDYITKPFSEEILQRKVELVLASQQRKRELESISDRAVEALERNLTNTDKLEMVVGFLHRCQRADSVEVLANSVFDCLRDFELDGSLLIEADGESRIWFSDGIDRPMEGQILESLRAQDRVMSFGTRLAINSDHATLLVRNLPADEDEMERLRQHLVIMIEGMDTRLHALGAQALIDARREMLTRSLRSTREKLNAISRLCARQARATGDIMASMADELEASLLQLGTSERQVKALLAIIEAGRSGIEARLDEQQKLGDQFAAMIDDLSGTLDE